MTVTTERRASDEVLARIDAWWRAANYLSVGQIYLLDNPLLRRPLDLTVLRTLVAGEEVWAAR